MGGVALRLLVDQSGYMLANAGDLAMLKVAAARLSDGAGVETVTVLNSAPGRFAETGVRGESLAVTGKRVYFRPGALVGPVSRRLERAGLGGAAEGLTGWEERLRTDRPGVYARLLGARLARRASDRSHLRDFVGVLKSADALCVSGGGFINDAFLAHGLSVLELAEWFLNRGRPVGLFGQGIGPARDPELRRRIAGVIPRCRVVGLREAETGPALLSELGADGPNVVVTGDDAIETARNAPGDAGFAGPARVGINVRVASYSGVSEEQGLRIVRAVGRCAALMGTGVQPVPISWHRGDSDVTPVLSALDLDESVRDEVGTPLSPEGVVRLVSRCSVVFTGSYHAGVFSLSRGVPVVALSASDYYDSKFLGLARQFGGVGLTIVRPDQADTPEKLLPVLGEAVAAGVRWGDRLRGLADEQIGASRSLYQRFLDSLQG